jgi:YD repeat-containing protein
VGPYGTLAWTYDQVGNRRSETRTPPGGTAQTRAYAYPATSNRLASVTLGAATERAFTYDAAGSLTGDTRSGVTNAYRIDDSGRMDQLTVGGTVRGRYTYDGRGRLAIRQRLNSTPSGTTHLIHDAWDRVIAETNGAGQTVREYVWLDDMPVAVLDGSATPASPRAEAGSGPRPLVFTARARS